jgi:hypothetical protein
MSVYVEIAIHGSMEDVWRRTQTPEEHARWDLRFTDIEYLARPDEAAPQRFLYRTRVGLGLEIAGEGETVGARDDVRGCRTSALKFWSGDPRSLILEGSGYWKYVASEDGIQFLTRYDYRTRFGAIGALLDRLAFRPLLGWATAWSFDSLRLWIERGVDPGLSRLRMLLHTLTRLTLAFMWIYQGLVPKLLFRDSGELSILQHSHLFHGREGFVLSLVGAGEILFGLALVCFWRSRGLLALNIAALVVLAGGALFSQPALFVAPFNPVVLNLSMAILAVVGLMVDRDLPTARNCRRSPETRG